MGWASSNGAQPRPRPVQYVSATLVQRAGSLLADGLVFFATVMVPSSLIAWWFGPDDFTSCDFASGREECSGITPEALRFTRTVFFSLSAVFLVVYSRYAGRGTTLGKRATETMLVDADTATPIGFGRALARSVVIGAFLLPVAFDVGPILLRLIPAIIGISIVVRDEHHRGPHDLVVGSRVISP